MLTVTATAPLFGTVVLSSPNGTRSYAWRTLDGRRLSGYVKTVGEARRALVRVQAHHGPARP